MTSTNTNDLTKESFDSTPSQRTEILVGPRSLSTGVVSDRQRNAYHDTWTEVLERISIL